MQIQHQSTIAISHICHQKNETTKLHSHLTGQLFVVYSGVISGYSAERRWTITPNSLGWIPANVEHSSMSWGNVTACCLHLSAAISAHLPKQTCILNHNELIMALINRICHFGDTSTLTEQQYRLIDVLLDEIRDAKPIDSLSLPSPSDPRLLKITQAIWQQPTSDNSQSQWAKWAGMSVRSLSRHFINQTGMTFSQWKQLAKLLISLEKLSQGLSINETAYLSGFNDASAYIASFKSIYGVSPKRYFDGENQFKLKD